MTKTFTNCTLRFKLHSKLQPISCWDCATVGATLNHCSRLQAITKGPTQKGNSMWHLGSNVPAKAGRVRQKTFQLTAAPMTCSMARKRKAA